MEEISGDGRRLRQGNCLKVAHQNIRSLLNKVDVLEVFLGEETPDILCLTEHCLRSYEVENIAIKNYNFISAFSRTRVNGGGVALWSHNNLTCHPLDCSTFCVERECELVATSFVINKEDKVLVVAGYRPPSGNLDLFMDNLSECLNRLIVGHMRVFVLGDFNVDLASESFNSQKLSTTMASFGLFNIISSYTREALNSKTLIDHIFTNEKSFKSEVVKSLLSDHHAQVVTILKSDEFQMQAKSCYARSFSVVNTETFKSLLKQETWENVYKAESLEEKFEEFSSQLGYHFELAFPLQLKKLRGSKTKKIKFPQEILDLKEECLVFYEKTKNLNSDHFLKQYYLRLKSKYRKTVRQLKANTAFETINQSENKTKGIWQVINEKRPRKETKHAIVVENHKGVLVKEPGEVCELLNTHFISVGKRFGKTSKQRAPIQVKASADSFFLSPTCDFEIDCLIKSLKNTKSAGVDEISARLLKSISHLVLAPLTHLVNNSFTEGTFPSGLKIAKVRPIPKKSNSSACDNFRPISILPTLSKIFEKAVLRRLWEFLLQNKLMFKNQHGFIKTKSTTSAILSLINDMVEDMDLGKSVVGLFFDLSKAFDMVNHSLLLEKMHCMGVRGVALDWFKSYLHMRRQFVVLPALGSGGLLRNHLSSEALIENGVPQGSVLGPILFLLFINDLPSGLREASPCLFADDTSLVLSNSNKDILELNCFLESNTLLQWCHDNHLHMNTGKTQLLNFSISKRSSKAKEGISEILLGEDIINASCDAKFLGVIIDENLNFHLHFEHVSKKASTGIFMLRQLRQTVDVEVLLSAYYGLIYPYLSYAVPVWGSESQRTLFLFRLQRRAIRIIFSLSRRQPCEEYFKKYQILTFPSIYILETLSFAQMHLNSFDRPNNQRYPLRNSANLSIPKHSSTFFKNHFVYNSVKLFNSLPQTLKPDQSSRKFRSHLRCLLVQGAYSSVREFTGESPRINF